jgi:hypothetical protein
MFCIQAIGPGHELNMGTKNEKEMQLYTQTFSISSLNTQNQRYKTSKIQNNIK